MITRNKSHEIALEALYAMLITIRNGQEVAFQTVLSDISGEDYAALPIFLKETLIAVLKHYDDIIAALTPHLTNWKFNRLNLVTQAILLYSYAHYTYIGEVTKAIVINVAVKLAKQYIPAEDYKFINAVLDGAL